MSCDYCAGSAWTEHPVCTCLEPCVVATCPLLLDIFDPSAVPVPQFRRLAG